MQLILSQMFTLPPQHCMFIGVNLETHEMRPTAPFLQEMHFSVSSNKSEILQPMQ